MKYIIILVAALIVIILVIFAFIVLITKSEKQWEELYELEKMAYNLPLDKSEIEKFHKHFVERANELKYNKYISIRLNMIDAFVRGLYKSVENQ